MAPREDDQPYPNPIYMDTERGQVELSTEDKHALARQYRIAAGILKGSLTFQSITIMLSVHTTITHFNVISLAVCSFLFAYSTLPKAIIISRGLELSADGIREYIYPDKRLQYCITAYTFATFLWGVACISLFWSTFPPDEFAYFCLFIFIPMFGLMVAVSRLMRTKLGKLESEVWEQYQWCFYDPSEYFPWGDELDEMSWWCAARR